MTFPILIRRSLRFYARAHFGVVLGAAIGSAALIGALLVGDSVRETLKERALARLDTIHFAVSTPERFFQESLARQSRNALSPSAKPTLPALVLAGVASKQDGSQRANRVNVLGVEPWSWPELAGWGEYPAISGARNLDQPPLPKGFADDLLHRWAKGDGDTAVINVTLARQLAVRVGDAIILRVRKPTALGLDAVITPRSENAVALRLTVGAIVPTKLLGDFSLAAQPQPPANLFLPLDFLAGKAGVPGQANLLLYGPLSEPRNLGWWGKRGQIIADWLRMRAWRSGAGANGQQPPGGNLATWRRLTGNRRIPPPPNGGGFFGRAADLFDPKPEKELSDQAAAPLLATQMEHYWTLQDAGISVHAFGPNSQWIEVTDSRIFLDPGVADAALRPRTTLLTNHFWFPGTTDTTNEIAAAQYVTNGVKVLTYLANLIRIGDRTTPYSMVTAAGSPYVPADMRDDEILVNEWLAEDLGVKPGDTVALSYYLADSGSRLTERTNSFRVRGIVPLQALYADRTLMPEFPGLAKAESTHDWDAGFPLVHKIRDKDEAYWKRYRGTPKAFITLAAGQGMWANRFGSLTAIRYPVQAGMVPNECHSIVYRNLLANLSPAEMGLRIEPVREQALRAATQGQDFGQLFLGFSFFLVVAALLLMALLFQFGLEQRAAEVGTLLALGFTVKQARRLLLVEGAALAFLGGVLGALGGVGYARAMLWGLTTMWRNAVGSTPLEFHATLVSLIIGFFASTAVAVLTIWLTLRKLARRPVPQLLTGGLYEAETASRSAGFQTCCIADFQVGRPSKGGQPADFRHAGVASATQAGLETRDTTDLEVCATGAKGHAGRFASRYSRGWAELLALVSAVVAAGIVLWALLAGEKANAGAFFGAGALLLVAGLAGMAVWLRTLARGSHADALTLGGLGVRGCARRRRRSLATAALLACGCFVIVSIGVFRLDAGRGAQERGSGTGGFALIGESTLPVVQDLTSQSGREFFGLGEQEMAGVAAVQFRVRAGDDASCLNLNRAQKPRLLGVKPESLVGRFTFTGAAKGYDRKKGWEMLRALGAPASLPASFEGRQVADRDPQEGARSKSKDPPSPEKGYGAARQGPAFAQEGLRRGEARKAAGRDAGALSADEPIPAIGDANSIQWALGKKLGDTLDYTDERGRAFKVRLVGAVANSILQGSLVIDEAAFVKRFPNESGYRLFLLDVPPNAVAAVSATLSRAMQDTGIQLTPAVERLNAFNAVQNTYLGTFQVLGGLGLLLGSAGLGVVVLRNVLERRGELGLLLAVGFRRRTLHRMVLTEHAALLGLGLGLGVLAAAVAVLPSLLTPGMELPYASLALTLAAVLLNGAAWTWVATRWALRGNLLAALRNE